MPGFFELFTILAYPGAAEAGTRGPCLSYSSLPVMPCRKFKIAPSTLLCLTLIYIWNMIFDSAGNGPEQERPQELSY